MTAQITGASEIAYLLRIDERDQQLKHAETLRYGRWLAWRQLMLQQSRAVTR
jgi:hypothetical protein